MSAEDRPDAAGRGAVGGSLGGVERALAVRISRRHGRDRQAGRGDGAAAGACVRTNERMMPRASAYIPVYTTIPPAHLPEPIYLEECTQQSRASLRPFSPPSSRRCPLTGCVAPSVKPRGRRLIVTHLRRELRPSRHTPLAGARGIPPGHCCFNIHAR